MITPHVQSFVLISMLRGQPKTPPSGDDLAVLNYHLKDTNSRRLAISIRQCISTMLKCILGALKIMTSS